MSDSASSPRRTRDAACVGSLQPCVPTDNSGRCTLAQSLCRSHALALWSSCCPLASFSEPAPGCEAPGGPGARVAESRSGGWASPFPRFPSLFTGLSAPHPTSSLSPGETELDCPGPQWSQPPWHPSAHTLLCARFTHLCAATTWLGCSNIMGASAQVPEEKENYSPGSWAGRQGQSGSCANCGSGRPPGPGP